MIHISRNLARQLRALFRRAKLHKTYGGFGPHVHLTATTDGLRIHSQNFDLGITHLASAPGSDGELWLPIFALDDFHGKDDSRVSLAPAGKHRVTAQWTDRGIPHAKDYEITPPKTVPEPSAAPTTWSPLTAEQWHRLGEATQAADESSSRYALGCLQLQGQLGQVAATDGRQVVIQAGYQFGFTDDVLIQASNILGSREVVGEAPIQIGRTDDWIVFTLGPWSLSFRIQKEGRFPNLETALPRSEAIQSRIILDDRDADFLLGTLPTLPGADGTNNPVTLDVRNGICVRGRAMDSQRITELALSHSRLDGTPVAINTNREYLLRAVQLGYREIGIATPDTPAVCVNESGTYGWAVLSSEGVIKPSESALRVDSATVGPTATFQPKPRTIPAMKPKPVNPEPAAEPVTASPPADPAIKSPIEQLLALRDTLYASARQANDLAKALKRHRREAELVRATLASLQELGKDAA